jgi:AcrR family transcriptional regulator
MSSSIEQQITRAAIREFSRVGFEATATKKIARLAKVSEGSIFRIFRTKEKLFARCIEQSYYENQSSGEFAKRLLSQNFKAAVADAVAAIFSHVSDDHIRLVYFGLLERPSVVRTSFDEMEAPKMLLASRISQEQNSGKVRPEIDARQAAEFLLNSISALQVQKATVEKLFKTESKLIPSPKIYVDLWCSAIARKKP